MLKEAKNNPFLPVFSALLRKLPKLTHHETRFLDNFARGNRNYKKGETQNIKSQLSSFLYTSPKN